MEGSRAEPGPAREAGPVSLTTEVSGGHCGGETPVPIPNTEVKPTSADGTWGEIPWESRTPPVFSNAPQALAWGAFIVFGSCPTTNRTCKTCPQRACPAQTTAALESHVQRTPDS